MIGSQIGQDPLKLRKWTVLKLKKSSQNLAKWLDKIQWKGNAGVFLMIGGVNGHGPKSPRTSPEEVRYSKRYPAHSQEEDARQLLEDSENVKGEGVKDVKEDLIDLLGHSREMHVVEGRNGGVEVYTRINKCSGVFAFQTEKDQDYVLHRALLSKLGQQALRKLDDTIAASADIYVSKLIEQNVPFPKASYWYAGNKLHESAEVKGVSLKLRHHKNKRNDKSAKPFIASIIPILQHFEERRCEETRYPLNNDIRHAKQILDDSHKLKNEFGEQGQSRIRHVVNGRNGGVQAWTRENRCKQKGAFQTEEDQDYVTHRALLSEKGRQALYYLYENDETVLNVHVNDMKEQGVSFPKGSHWHKGIQLDDNKDIRSVQMFLRHHADKREEKNAEPFILTVFPILQNIKQRTCTPAESRIIKKIKQAKEGTRKRALPTTTSKTASATTSKAASKTPPKIALKTATGTIRKTGHVTTSETVHKITPTTSHKPTPKSTRILTSKIPRKTAP